MAEKNVHLGCGPHALAGWINTDLVPQFPDCRYLDVRGEFPFADGTVQRFFAEHMIEHLTVNEGGVALTEMYRCLASGGRIRLTTPNLRNLMLLGTPDCPPIAREFSRFFNELYGLQNGFGAVDTLNSMFYCFGHRYLYDFDTLKQLCERVGFANVEHYEVHASGDPVLREVERHTHDGRLDLARFECFALEAVKP